VTGMQQILDALHTARIELGAYLQVGSMPSTARTFAKVNAAIEEINNTYDPPTHPDGRPEWHGKQLQGPHPAPKEKP
jgi:hypothetical protein